MDAECLLLWAMKVHEPVAAGCSFPYGLLSCGNMFSSWLCVCVNVLVLVRTLLSKSEVFTQALMTYSSESTRPSQLRICFLASSPAELRFL